MIIKSNKSKSWSVRQAAGDPGKLMVQVQSKGICWRILLFLEEDSRFFLFRPSPDWIKPTNIEEGSLHYSKFTDLNVNLM